MATIDAYSGKPVNGFPILLVLEQLLLLLRLCLIVFIFSILGKSSIISCVIHAHSWLFITHFDSEGRYDGRNLCFEQDARYTKEATRFADGFIRRPIS